MTIEEEIIAWEKKRPNWQRNILKRICRLEVVDDAYITRLSKLIVANEVELEKPELQADDLPMGTAGRSQIQLRSIGNVRNVNALLSDQTLTFGETGITVIYGDNGCGKSGYARLAKQLSGSRHREAVLPNAYIEKAAEQSASVSYRVDDDSFDITWPIAENLPLRQIHFYDEACGDDYLINDTELSYRPSVLVIFDELIRYIDQIRRVIEGSILELDRDQLKLPMLHAGTAAQIFSQSIQEAMAAEAIDAFLKVSDEQRQKHADRVREEARLRTTDPTKEKQRLTAAAKSISALVDHLDQVRRRTTSSVGVNLEELRREAAALRESASAVSVASFANEPLAGIGTHTWRAMWEAAERYSTAEAYVGRDFPPSDTVDRCVLCQQSLDEEAGDRLRRFHRFIHDDVAQRAATAERTFEQEVQSLRTFQVSTAQTSAGITVLREEHNELAVWVQTFLDQAVAARARILDRVIGETSEPCLELGHLELDALRTIADDLQERAAKIDAAEFRESLRMAKEDMDELGDLIVLSGHKQALLDEVKRLKDRSALQKAKSTTSTAAVTKISTELARTYATQAVRNQFILEARALRVDMVTLGDKGGAKGQLRQKPTLEGATKTSNPREVLSEGEQTAAGLAGIFTEITFDSSKSAVIFDDPVSSLDHERRDKVARRIVELGRDRQIIIFTHDLMFLGEIVKSCDELQVSLTERTIERNGARQPGFVVDGHPWKAKDAGKRIQDLRETHAKIKRLQLEMSATDYEREVSDWAGKLSETWERIVRSEVANKVVDRGTTEVRPRMFRILAKITEDDNLEFQAGYGMTSKWARRHDKSEEVNFVPPTPDEMLQELERLEGWRKRVVGYAS